ncbi:DUF3025 domain-containing protein [Psychrobacter sp. JB385]|uniref:DUF3025 domain-containing protein n=1 Tax=Psychrobacter sp. JB385 TaxID=1434841 RepID=UPI00097F4EC8|nr:DUF3025 domain-containing protein [Psychrobacter sp. JB385]SJN30284.1 probable putative transmembrane protein [Psychrobacter sp. JB385]
MTATDLPFKTPSHASFNDLPILDNQFADIDWQAPWLCHLNQLDYLSKTVHHLSSFYEESNGEIRDDQPIDIVAGILNNALHLHQKNVQVDVPTTKPTQGNQAQTLTFVSQNALPEGDAYESFIAKTGNIPTRDNLHDLFNGSIWLTFPKTKALLNYHHMLEIAAQGIGERRGRVRDTITVFDENGAILVTSDRGIGEGLKAFDWQASLVTSRAQWDNPTQVNRHAQAAVYIFGHALLEQLIQPRKPLCAHSLVIYVTQDFFVLPLSERMAYLDDALAQQMNEVLCQDGVTPRHLSPLPILGVPHFCSENEHTHFYDDPYVFRSGRRQKAKG